ncbi:MAG: HAD-IIIA family hydrolase [Rhodospirillales bacterium]|nr:HAD-IIIA family hydrolase [Rhodospirillales bacterium]
MPRAPIRQCAILAGGMATRLGALAADTPKPALEVGGRPFLFWLLRELSRFGIEEVVLLAGHLAAELEAIMRAAARELPRPMRLTVSTETIPAGTGGALRQAASLLDAQFLLCNGDSLFDTNLAELLARRAADDAATIGRLALRALPDASRYGVIAREGERITGFAERPAPGAPGIINAGIYALDRTILDRCAPNCSLERDVLPALAAEGALAGAPSEGWFVDIGIPADLARARAELPGRLRRNALFLDRDGVLNRDLGHVGSRARWEWMPGAQAAVRAATARGWHVFVVTNQSGVARGFYTEDDVRDLMVWAADSLRQAGGTIDDWRFCPYHPEAPLADYRRESGWRKPEPGMILDLIRAWTLDPAGCVLVGDQPSDLAAARAAGIAAHLFSGGDLAEFVAPLFDASPG